MGGILDLIRGFIVGPLGSIVSRYVERGLLLLGGYLVAAPDAAGAHTTAVTIGSLVVAGLIHLTKRFDKKPE